MLGRLVAAAAIAPALLISAAEAGEPQWFSQSRTVEPSGRYYVVVSAPARYDENFVVVSEPAAFFETRALSLAERRPDSSPVAPTGDVYRDWPRGCMTGFRETLDVRSGDIVHGRIVFAREPNAICVSSAGSGFAALWLPKTHSELSDASADGDAMAIVSSKCEIRFRKKLAELFSTEELALVARSEKAIGWPWSTWFDDARRQLVIVGGAPAKGAQPPLVRMVDLDSGIVTAGSREVVVTALEKMNRPALEAALDLAVDWKLDVVGPAAERILDDGESPRIARLHAARVLFDRGDSKGAQLVAETIRSWQDYHFTDARFAISNARSMLGMQSVPVFREAVLSGWQFRESMPYYLAELGVDAVPDLVEMLGDAKHIAIQSLALDTLLELGPAAKQGVPALTLMLERADRVGDWSLRVKAARALGLIGPEAKTAVPALTTTLERADRADDWSLGVEAARALGLIGLDAKTAVPALRHFACRANARLQQAKCRRHPPSYDWEIEAAEANYDAFVKALEKICSK